MLTAILIIEAIKLLFIAILVYNTWPTMTVKESGWKPKNEVVDFPEPDDSVIVMDEAHEAMVARESADRNAS